MIPPLAVFLTAFIIRYFHIAGQETRDDFFSYFWLVDASPYLSYANKILTNDTFLAWQSPLISYILSVFFYLSDGSHFSGKLVLATISAGTCVGVYFLAKQLMGVSEAIVAAFLSVSSFGLIISSGSYNSEVLHGLLLITVLYVCNKFVYKKTFLIAGLIGALCGLSVFNRGEFVLMVLPITAWLFYYSRVSFKHSILIFGIYVLAFLIVLFPNIYRNYDYFHSLNLKIQGEPFREIYFLAPYNQFIFARSNSPLNPVRFERRIFGSNENTEQTEVNFVSNPLHRKMFLEGRRLGWEYILEDIPRFLVTSLQRTKVLFDVFSFGFLQTNWPSGLTGRHGKGDCFTSDEKIFIWFHLPLFFLGVAVAWSRRSFRHILPSFLVGATLIINVFYFGMTRFGVYLLPLILIYTAAGIVLILRKIWKLGRCKMIFDSEGKISLVLSGLLIALGIVQYFLEFKVIPARDFFLDGVVSLQKENYENTITEWESAFQKIKKNNNVIRDDLMLGRFSFKLAGLYYINGNAEKALKELDRTLTFDPFHMNGLLNRGVLSTRFRNSIQAKADFWNLVKWYPNHPQAKQALEHIVEPFPIDLMKANNLKMIWSDAL